MEHERIEPQPHETVRRIREGRWQMIRRILRFVLTIAVLLAVLPLALVPLYAVEGVHPASTLMLADHFSFRPVEREWVDLEDVAPVLVHSVMMSEDGQFCRHDGIDWGEMRAVIDEALEGEETRGASTIPMQTVKNLFLWHGRSYLRKALEAPLALYADAVLSKRRLMEIYLNIVEWDVGVYGVEAASWHYFGKPAFALTAREAALLAVTLPAPTQRNPAEPGPGLRRLADTIEARAKAAGDYVGCLDGDAA